MKRILKCNDCDFEKEIEYTPPKEMERKGIETKGRPKCDKCGSENVKII
jgi:Zn finger protein HypA/HybF involved in hydrogenase expression